MLECIFIYRGNCPVQFLTQVNNKLICIAKDVNCSEPSAPLLLLLSNCNLLLCWAMWCGDAVCWVITGQEAWPSPSLTRQHNPCSNPSDINSDIKMCSMQHRGALLTFSLLLSWFAVTFFVSLSCDCSILNPDAVNESIWHLLQWCMMQCTELCLNLLPCPVHEAA